MSDTTREVSGNMRTLTDSHGNIYTFTDSAGRIVADEITEPATASIVMVAGMYGNAWQRHGNDGLWHSTTGAVRRWSQMLRMRNLVLVYEAAEREPEPEPVCEHGVKGCTARPGHIHVEVQR